MTDIIDFKQAGGDDFEDWKTPPCTGAHVPRVEAVAPCLAEAADVTLNSGSTPST